VLDASQSQRAAIVATRETGQIAILYAGMHPDESRLWFFSIPLLDTWRLTTIQSEKPQRLSMRWSS